MLVYQKCYVFFTEKENKGILCCRRWMRESDTGSLFPGIEASVHSFVDMNFTRLWQERRALPPAGESEEENAAEEGDGRGECNYSQ